MDYPIPASTEEILALGKDSVNEEIVATAIAGVVKIAREKGQSLEDLISNVQLCVCQGSELAQERVT